MNSVKIDKILKYATQFRKIAQATDPVASNNLTNSLVGSIQAINVKQLTLEKIKEQAYDYLMNATRNLQNKPPMITPEQYGQITKAYETKINESQTYAASIPTVNVNDLPKAPTKQPTPQAAKQRGAIGINYLYQNRVEEVKSIQRFLRAKGFYKFEGEPDGLFGDLTSNALKTWQTNSGLKQKDGRLNQETMNKLMTDITTHNMEMQESLLARQKQTTKKENPEMIAPPPKNIDKSLPY